MFPGRRWPSLLRRLWSPKAALLSAVVFAAGLAGCQGAGLAADDERRVTSEPQGDPDGRADRPGDTAAADGGRAPQATNTRAAGSGG